MNQGCKKKWKGRIYSYLYDMKTGEEQKVSAMIVADIEIYVLELSIQIAESEKNILVKEKEVMELKKELRGVKR